MESWLAARCCYEFIGALGVVVPSFVREKGARNVLGNGIGMGFGSGGKSQCNGKYISNHFNDSKGLANIKVVL